MATDLQHAVSCIFTDAAFNNSWRVDDIDEIKEALDGFINSAVDSYCTYYPECLNLITRLESDYSEYCENVDEPLYSAADYLKAAQAYAVELLTAALNDQAGTALDEIADALAEFCDVVDGLGGDIDGASISIDCAYGWAVHNYETASGVMVWSNERHNANGCFNPELLEGELIAVSAPLGFGLYANICFKPESESEAA